MNNSPNLAECARAAGLWCGGEVMQEELPVELNVQVFSAKCHLLCSVTSFPLVLIRQVAVSRLSLAVTHTLSERLVEAIPELSESRSLLLQTAAFSYMYSITGFLSLCTAALSSSHSHKHLSDYTGGFCHSRAHKVLCVFASVCRSG